LLPCGLVALCPCGLTFLFLARAQIHFKRFFHKKSENQKAEKATRKKGVYNHLNPLLPQKRLTVFNLQSLHSLFPRHFFHFHLHLHHLIRCSNSFFCHQQKNWQPVFVGYALVFLFCCLLLASMLLTFLPFLTKFPKKTAKQNKTIQNQFQKEKEKENETEKSKARELTPVNFPCS
jgi:hypothetical protein